MLHDQLSCLSINTEDMEQKKLLFETEFESQRFYNIMYNLYSEEKPGSDL